MGGLRQEALCRTAASPGLPGPLYPSRSHLQQSHPQHRGRPSNLSLQGLSPWQPAENHDLIGGRVHPSLPVACLARGISPHPLPQRKTPTVSSSAGNDTARTRLLHRSGRAGLSRPLPGSYGFFPVGMPRLPPWAHDHNRRDSSWLHSDHHRHLMRTRLTFDSALPELAFPKSAAKCSLSSLLSSITSSFRSSRPQSAPAFCPPHYSPIMVFSAFCFLLILWCRSKTLKATRSPSAAQRFTSIDF